jgi:hypothetical protein
MVKAEGISKQVKFSRSPCNRLKGLFARKSCNKDFDVPASIFFEVVAGTGDLLPAI